MNSQSDRVLLFNSPTELGLRALCLLVELHPAPQDIQRLVLLDYILVHSSDVEGGPGSLHAPVPQRGSEILVRRSILEPGLRLYVRRDLICPHWGDEGFTYGASERGAGFLDSLRTKHVRALRERAEWITEQFGALSTSEIRGFVNSELDRWGGQFETSTPRRPDV